MDQPSSRLVIAPIGLLGALVLMLATESYLAANPLDFGMPDWGEWSFSATAARGRVRNCDILCFGDSMLKCGLQPRVLESVLGRRAYNLAVSAASAPASYYLFRRALKHGAKPAAVVVDFQPTLLTEGPETVGLWGQLLEFPELVELAWNCRDGDLFARSALQRYVPSIRGRAEIRLNVLAAVFGIPMTHRQVCLGRIRNWNQNRGAFVGPVNPTYRGEIGPAEQRHLARRTWNKVDLAYVHEFLALAESKDLPVFLIVPPLAPELEISRKRLGLGARYDQLIRDWQTKFPHLSVLDARGSEYAATEFCDPVHLNRAGAVALSLDVGATLKHRINASRLGSAWVTLPLYRNQHDDSPLEDFFQSTAVVRSVGLTRR